MAAWENFSSPSLARGLGFPDFMTLLLLPPPDPYTASEGEVRVHELCCGGLTRLNTFVWPVWNLLCKTFEGFCLIAYLFIL